MVRMKLFLALILASVAPARALAQMNSPPPVSSPSRSEPSKSTVARPWASF